MPPTPRPLPAISPFDGTATDYIHRFRPAVLTTAFTSSFHSGVLLFDMLSDAERLQRWPPTPDHPHTPSFAELPVPPPLTQLPDATPTNVFTLCTRLTDEYNLFLSERANLFIWLLDATPQSVRNRIANFHTITTSRQLLAALDAKFRTLPAAELHALQAKLDLPYSDGTAIDAYLTEKERIFAIREEQGIPLSNFDQFTSLHRGVAHSTSFQQCLIIYFQTHPLMQQQSYDTLAQALRTHNIQTTTAASFLTAAAAVSTQHPTAAKPKKHTGTYHSPRAPTNRPSTDTPSQYCHTHGITYHTSAQCKHPGPAHKVEATIDNKMGGSEAIATPNPFFKRKS